MVDKICEELAEELVARGCCGPETSSFSTTTITAKTSKPTVVEYDGAFFADFEVAYDDLRRLIEDLQRAQTIIAGPDNLDSSEEVITLTFGEFLGSGAEYGGAKNGCVDMTLMILSADVVCAFTAVLRRHRLTS